MKILIIEDELVLAESIETYLSESGFICQIASTVSDALEKILFYDEDCISLIKSEIFIRLICFFAI